MDWKSTLGALAPTVASALLGPLGGAAVSAIGGILGIDAPTQDKIAKAIQSGQLTPEQLSEIKKLELQYQNDEKERGFRYAELEFKDRDSARQMMAVSGAKTPAVLTWIIVSLVLGLEGAVLFYGTPEGVSEIVLGRVLGTLDTALMMALAFWFGTTHGSGRKTDQMVVADKP